MTQTLDRAGEGLDPRTRSAGVLRWTGRAVLAVLAMWLLAGTVNQLITGSYWLGAAPNPLPALLYFAGPPLLLAAAAMLVLARTSFPRRDRLLLSFSIAAAGVAGLHLLLSGRTWIWVLPDLMPPLLFLLIPLALLGTLAVVWLRRLPLRRPVAVSSAVLTVLALAHAFGAGQAGLNLAAVSGGVTDGPAPPGAVRVVTWDTLFWANAGNADRFYRFMTERRADVYLLQDYPHPETETFQLIRDSERLRREFPGYHFANAGGLLTISRFPIVRRVPMETNVVPPPGTDNMGFLKSWKYGVLRTDLDIDGRVFSAYNVHFYDRYYLDVLPLTPTFFRNIRGLDLGRRVQFDRLLADLDVNPNPLLVSGNFNSLPNTGELDRLGHLKDAGRADRSIYPASLKFFGPSLWRMDWTFTSPAVGVHHYDLIHPGDLSSRHLQDVVLSLPS